MVHMTLRGVIKINKVEIEKRKKEIEEEYKAIFDKVRIAVGEDAEKIDNLWSEYKKLCGV